MATAARCPRVVVMVMPRGGTWMGGVDTTSSWEKMFVDTEYVDAELGVGTKQTPWQCEGNGLQVPVDR